MNPRAKVKHKVGTGECFACKREVVWRQSEGGALTATCQHCDLQLYAKHGTEAERLLMGNRITRTAAPQSSDKPAPAPQPESKPAPKPAPKSGAFGAFGL